MIFVAEEATAEKRGFYLNVFMAIGIVGPMMSPIFRSIFLTETAPVTAWRGMTIFPIIIGITAGIAALAGAKETRLYEEFKLTKVKSEAEPENVSFVKNMRVLMANPRKKEILAIMVMSIIAGLNFILLQLGESFITYNVGLTQGQVNTVITIIAVAMIVAYLITGKLSDKTGRVPLVYVFSMLLPAATILLNLGVIAGSNAVLLVAIGMILGYTGYYVLWTLLRVILMEIVATGRRGTASGLRAIIQAIGTTIGFGLGAVISLAWGLGVAFIILSMPMFAIPFLTKKYLKETKGIKLDTIAD